jgi:hypothetical protein
MHKNNIISDCIFKQNLCSSICQLVNDCKATNGTTLSSDIIPAWDTFGIKYPANVYKVNLASGNSQCISEACTIVAISYLNNMVELFEAKVLQYIRYILQNAFMVSIKY